MAEVRKGNVVGFPVRKVRAGTAVDTDDELAAEEPLEIRLEYDDGGERKLETISVTMRTPGNDFELAAGFLYGEGVLGGRDDVGGISYCTDPGEEQRYNIVNVRLNPWVKFDPASVKRNFYMSSSCGVCGKASIESLQKNGCTDLSDDDVGIEEEVITALPAKLREAQQVFNLTGGLHASGLFDRAGKMLVLREDVGRHNALDKLVGSQLLANRLPLRGHILAVSGRTSFELVQKALVAGIPIVVGVGAPSSLAAELAREFHMTLIGFAKQSGFNVYTGSERVAKSETAPKVATT